MPESCARQDGLPLLQVLVFDGRLDIILLLHVTGDYCSDGLVSRRGVLLVLLLGDEHAVWDWLWRVAALHWALSFNSTWARALVLHHQGGALICQALPTKAVWALSFEALSIEAL